MESEKKKIVAINKTCVSQKLPHLKIVFASNDENKKATILNKYLLKDEHKCVPKAERFVDIFLVMRKTVTISNSLRFLIYDREILFFAYYLPNICKLHFFFLLLLKNDTIHSKVLTISSFIQPNSLINEKSIFGVILE